MIVKKHLETQQIYALHKNLYSLYGIQFLYNVKLLFFLIRTQTGPCHLQPICIPCDLPSTSPIDILFLVD